MRMAQHFDISTLAWVKGEIDETLKQARLALEAYAEAGASADKLAECIALLHQVGGTLQVVEIEGAALIAAEIEAFAQFVHQGEVGDVAAAHGLLMQGILQLPDYLDSLLGGAADNPLVLLGLLNDMRQRRADTPLDGEAFFRPPLDVSVPPTGTAAGHVDARQAAEKLHRFYLTALAKVLKDKEVKASLKLLAELLARLLASASVQPWRRLLWVAQALLEGLQDGSIALDKDSKLLLGKLEQQLKQVAKQGEPTDQDEGIRTLLYRLLWVLASSGAQGKTASAVRLAFRLDEYLPASTASGGINAELKKTVAADVIEELTRIKDAFDIFVRSDRGQPETLQAMVQNLASVADTLGLLQQENLQQVLQEQTGVLRQLLAGECALDDDALMGVAGAILAVESALLDWGDEIPLVDADAAHEQVDSQHSPQAQAEHQRVIRQVMRESREDLVRVRDAISVYLHNPGEKAVLEPLPRMLQAIIGGLRMLSYKRAADALLACQSFVERELLQAEQVPAAARLDALADAMMSVEYYLEAFIHNRVHPGSALDVAEEAIHNLGYALDSIAENSVAAAVLTAPQQEDGEPDSSAVETTLADAQPGLTTESAAEAGDTIKTPSLAEAIDDDILAIFIEEAEEELAKIREALPAWQRKPHDQAALATLRRSFHTLKGSGRLVGASEIAEFAWAFEGMLNRVIDGSLASSAAMLDMLEQAQEVLPGLIAAFRRSEPAAMDVEILREMAEAIAQGKVASPAQQIAKPSAPSFSPAQPLPELDPVLLEIYSKETEGHLQQLEHYISDHQRGLTHKASEPLIRALHTLKGSSRMAEVEPIGALCEILEKYAKAVQAGHETVSEQGLAALQAAMEFIPQVLACLADPALPLPETSPALDLAIQAFEQVKHLEAVANAQPEAGLAGQAEAIPENLAEVVSSGLSADDEAESLPAAGEPVATEAEMLLASFAHPRPGIEDDGADEELLLPELDGDDRLETEQDWAGALLEEGPAELEEVPAALSASMAEAAASGGILEEDYDEELLGIFLEEGAEILDASEETLQQWIKQPGEHSLVKLLQRQLHTLKGGARMAGIAPIGDLSHRLESVFEALSEGLMPSSPALLDVLQLAHDRLVIMLEQVRNHQPAGDGEDLIKQLEQLARGQAAEVGQGPQQAVSLDPVPDIEGDNPVADALALMEETAPAVATLVAGQVGSDPLQAALEGMEAALGNWLRDSDEVDLLAAALAASLQLATQAQEQGHPEIAAIIMAVHELLQAISDGHVLLSGRATDLIGIGMGRIGQIMDEILAGAPKSDGNFVIADIQDLIFIGKSALGLTTPPPQLPDYQQGSVLETVSAMTGDELAQQRRASRIQHDMVRVRADLLDELVNHAGEVSIYRSRVEQQIANLRGQIQEMDQTITRLRGQVRQFEIENETQIASRREEVRGAGEDFDPLEFDRFTHMQELSRAMMESLNDLLSIEDYLDGMTRETETLLVQQARVNSELQESLTNTRMVPLVDSAPRLRRVVRQTAAELGKRASLVFEGVEVELDRSVVERLMAPLEHMLRNSLAHGIETPAERVQAGKAEEGQIRIALSREGSEIVILLSDDGAGINLDALRAKAIERGLMGADSKLSDKEIARFILQSGVTTADSLSQVAGRGVGMDVVGSEIKQLGGVLDINSLPGQGSTFTIRLPLTLTVSRALLVQVADAIYAIPLLAIRSIERVASAELEALFATEQAHYPWMGEDYALMHLTDVLGLGRGVMHSETGKQAVLLAGSGEQRVALAVDKLLGSREVVVKSLGPLLSPLNELAGATILADGSVAPILDMPALIRRGLAVQQAGLGRAEGTTADIEPLVMVVDDSITVRKVTERLLKRHKLRCITAKDGVDALAMLEDRIPDVMLLDIEMPRMDGFELATHMRNAETLRQVPIIMITSRSGEKHRQRAQEIGVNMYMGKPYTETDLLNNIGTLLGREPEL